MDNMTEKEKKVVEELRKRTINDVTPKMLEETSVFYRFAKARDFNIVEAENMLRKHIVWRKELEIDTILTDYEPPEVLLKYAPTTFICFDKKGNAVRLQDCGRADVKGLLSLATKREWEKYCAFVIEQDLDKIIKQRGNLGRPSFFSLEDLADFSYANAISMKTLQFLFPNVKMFVDNYPEILMSITIINAPFYFSWTFAAVKPILPSTVAQKVRIYGKDGWKEVLTEEIDVDSLPAYLGGNRTDPDGNPLCESFIVRGQPIPKSYYMQNRVKKLSLESAVEKLTMMPLFNEEITFVKKLSRESDVETVTVMPFSKEEITFEVKDENFYLEWEFQINRRGIDFSLFFKGESLKDLDPLMLIPKQRIDAIDESKKGCFTCDKLGNYTIVFDNSYDSQSKEVYYRVRLRNLKNEDIYKPA
ncbi:retinal-binding protein-like [Argiope bruennichi]|uniref:retinal-binding protein-like n=1 Tax=Argiope bruennichi TaxID=94029 RepID=UPI002494566B|nr:retinal-binding protein-like [Argiope bruennichi]XP_055938622.1 retinal-binding protein-like [Argiope bruennichi]